MPGTIKLLPKYTLETKPRRWAYYENFEDLCRIIEVWRSIYKSKFENFYIHAIPKINNHATTQHAKEKDPL